MHQPNWIALIHVARRELHLSEESYRAVLAAAGVESSKNIRTQAQADLVINAMKAMGFTKKPATRRPKWKDDWWRCTPAQRAKIEVLWSAVARSPTQESLRRMVARIIHVDSPAWISVAQASKVIVALSAMAKTAGQDPDAAVREDCP